MSNKKLVLLAVLLILQPMIAVLDKNVSALEYVCLFAQAGAYLIMTFRLKADNEQLYRMLAGRRLEHWSNLIKIGMGEHIREIEALPKIPSATGQIYVDYEEVMRILRGDEIVER